MKKYLLLAAAAFCVSSAAHASIIPVLDSVTPDGANFDFNYHITLSGDQGLTDGSKLVIYDFLGYVPGSIFNPAFPDITASTEGFSSQDTSTGGVQANATFTDDPLIPNLVWTYHGPDFRTTAPGTDIVLTGFGATSIYGGVTSDGFSARAIKNSGLGTVGTDAFNNGAVGVPTPQGGPRGGVPEPAAWAMMILGFGGIGSVLRSRRRPAVA